MKRIVIPHPDGDREWPRDYLPRPVSATHYVCPLDAVAEDGGENQQPWDEQEKTGCLMPQAHHDPVFLVLFDLHYLPGDTSTIAGSRERMSVLAEIAVYDRRGYIKPQLGSVVMALKNCADLHDWDKFIADLEDVEVELDEIEEQIHDEDLAENKSRQHDGYAKCDTKKGKQLLNKIIEGTVR